jgi:acyl carrier protein
MSDKTITERIIETIVDQLGVRVADVVPAAHLHQDLGADSLDDVELIMALEQEFDIVIPDEAAGNIRTVADMIVAVENEISTR